MKDEDERPSILISHTNLHDDESVHCYRLCFSSKILHEQTVLISLGTCNRSYTKCNAYVKLWRENKEYCLVVCLFAFGKRPIMQKPFILKCLCYETF